MTFIIDIDDTILVANKIKCDKCNRLSYENAEPILNEIEAVNKLYSLGHIIIFLTGRNWDCYKQTVIQLYSLKVKYHNLIMGKPQGIYIDRTDNLNSVFQALKLVGEKN